MASPIVVLSASRLSRASTSEAEPEAVLAGDLQRDVGAQHDVALDEEVAAAVDVDAVGAAAVAAVLVVGGIAERVDVGHDVVGDDTGARLVVARALPSDPIASIPMLSLRKM